MSEEVMSTQGPLTLRTVDVAPPLSLHIGSNEVMRFTSDGDVIIRGEKVDSNGLVYETFRAFLSETTGLPAALASRSFHVKDREGRLILAGSVAMDVGSQAEFTAWLEMTTRAFRGEGPLSIFIDNARMMLVTEGFKPLGFMQSLELSASVDSIPPKLTVVVPEVNDQMTPESKKGIQESVAAITRHGGTVTYKPSKDHVLAQDAKEQGEAEGTLKQMLGEVRPFSSLFSVFVEDVKRAFAHSFGEVNFTFDARRGIERRSNTQIVIAKFSTKALEKSSVNADALAMMIKKIAAPLDQNGHAVQFWSQIEQGSDNVRVGIEVVEKYKS